MTALFSRNGHGHISGSTGSRAFPLPIRMSGRPALFHSQVPPHRVHTGLTRPCPDPDPVTEQSLEMHWSALAAVTKPQDGRLTHHTVTVSLSWRQKSEIAA